MYPTSTYKCGQTNEKARKTDDDWSFNADARPEMHEAKLCAGHVVGGRAFWGGGLPGHGLSEKRGLVRFGDRSELIYQIRREDWCYMLLIYSYRAGHPIVGRYEIELIEGGRDYEGTYRPPQLKLICQDTGKSGRKLYLLPGAARFKFPKELPTNLKRDADRGARVAIWFSDDDPPPPRLDDRLFEGLLRVESGLPPEQPARVCEATLLDLRPHSVQEPRQPRLRGLYHRVWPRVAGAVERISTIF